ncbi:MAG: translocation/assembly module TamB domain-containing protein [Proteobacteria bacterium]|nr:translocation/assembly module TamB domain-containing protein [Pseudomonadota bacterium]
MTTEKKNGIKTGVPRSKRIIYSLIALLSILCLFGMAGLLFIQTPTGAGWITRNINAHIPGKVELGKFSLRLHQGDIELWNVRIETPEGETVISLKSLSCRILLSKLLLEKKLHIDFLALDQPDVNLSMNDSKMLNIIRAFVRPQPEGAGDSKTKTGGNDETVMPFNIVLDHLAIKHGHFQYAIPHQSFGVDIADINLKGQGNLFDEDASVKGTIGVSTVNIPPYYQTAIDHGRIAVALKNRGLESIDLNLSGPTLELSAAGSIKTLFSDPLFQIKLSLARLDLKKLFDDLFLTTNITGTVHGQISYNGRLNDPDIDLSLVHENGSLQVCEVKKLQLQASMKKLQVNIDKLQADMKDGHLKGTGHVNLSGMFPKGLISAPVLPGALSLDLHLAPDKLDLSAFTPLKDKLKGFTTGKLDMSLTGVDPKLFQAEVKTALMFSQTRINAYQIPGTVQLNLDGQMDEGVVTCRDLRLFQKGFNFTSKGMADIVNQRMNVQAKLEIDQNETLTPLPVPELKGHFSSEMKLSGTFKKPIVTVELKSDKLAWDNRIVAGDVDLLAGLTANGTFSIDRLTIRNKESLIEGKGQVALLTSDNQINSNGNLTAELELKNTHLEDFLSDVPITGLVNGKINVSGSIQSPEGDVSLSAETCRYAAYQIDTLALGLKLKEGIAAVDRLSIQRGRSDMIMEGRIHLFEVSPFKLDPNPGFTVDIVKGDLFIEDFIEPYKGEVTLSGKLGGHLKTPKGDIRVKGKDLDLKYQHIDEADLRLALDNQLLTLSSLRISPSQYNSIEGSGWFSLEGDHAYEIDMKTSELTLQHIDILSEKDFKGNLDIVLSGRGTVAEPGMEGKVRGTRVKLEGKDLADISLDLSVRDKKLFLDGLSNGFSLNGQMAIDTRSFSMNARFTHTDLTPYIQVFRNEDIRLKLNGDIMSTGNLDDIKNLGLMFSFDDVDFRFEDLFYANTKCLKGSFDKGRIDFAACRFALPENGWISAKGHGEPKGPYDFSFEGHMPLQIASLFTEDLSDITGNFQFKARLGGSYETPDFNATVSVENAAFILVDLEQKMHNLNGLITFSNNRINIDHIKGNIDAGRFEFSGYAGLDGFTPVYLSAALKAHGLPFNIPDTMSVIINTDLKIEGTPDQTSATGDITLVEGTYYKNHKLNLVQGLSRRERETSPVQSDIDLPFLKNLDLDIFITPQNPFVVDNNLAKLDIVSDLRIGGRLNNPVIKGRTTIKDGTVTYFKKTFTVERGIIDFINPYKTEPSMTLKASTVFRDWTITLDISGPPDNLVCILSSVPYEHHEDILSLLVLGKTYNEIQNKGGGSSSTPEQMLADLVTATFDKDIKEKTGLDIIEVNGSGTKTSNGTGQSDQLQLTVGKELSPRLILKYAVENTDNGINQKTMAEYKFFEHILLNGFQDSKGDYGGELELRLEFR